MPSKNKTKKKISKVTGIAVKPEGSELDSFRGMELYARLNVGIGIPIETLANVTRTLEHHRSQLCAWKSNHPE